MFDPQLLAELSFHEKHEILRIAAQHAAGEVVDHLLWPRLRKLLHSDPQRLPDLVTAIKRPPALAGFEGIDVQSNDIIRRVVQRRCTLDAAFELLLNATVVDLKAIEGLLARGANVELPIHRGMRPLHLAAFRNMPACASLLIEYGASVNAVDEFENTPMHYAATCGAEDVAVLLYQMDANLTMRNRAGHLPLEGAEAGYAALMRRLEHAVGVRHEAVLRARRLYVKLMEGDPVSYGDPDERPESFFMARVLAAILILKPQFFTGERERKRLVPDDLWDLERLSRKVWGSDWREPVALFDLLSPDHHRAIAHQIFEDRLTTAEVAAALAHGKQKYEEQRALYESEQQRLRHEHEFNLFLAWLRNGDAVHHKLLMRKLRKITLRMSPIALLHVEHIIGSDDKLTVYMYEHFHGEDKAALDALRQVYAANFGSLLTREKPKPPEPTIDPAEEARRRREEIRAKYAVDTLHYDKPRHPILLAVDMVKEAYAEVKQVMQAVTGDIQLTEEEEAKLEAMGYTAGRSEREKRMQPRKKNGYALPPRPPTAATGGDGGESVVSGKSRQTEKE